MTYWRESYIYIYGICNLLFHNQFNILNCLLAGVYRNILLHYIKTRKERTFLDIFQYMHFKRKMLCFCIMISCILLSLSHTNNHQKKNSNDIPPSPCTQIPVEKKSIFMKGLPNLHSSTIVRKWFSKNGKSQSQLNLQKKKNSYPNNPPLPCDMIQFLYMMI